MCCVVCSCQQRWWWWVQLAVPTGRRSCGKLMYCPLPVAQLTDKCLNQHAQHVFWRQSMFTSSTHTNTSQQNYAFLHAAAWLCLLSGVNEDVRLPEAAFFHKASKTLLVTDAVVYVDRDPPDVIPSKVGSDLVQNKPGAVWLVFPFCSCVIELCATLHLQYCSWQAMCQLPVFVSNAGPV